MLDALRATPCSTPTTSARPTSIAEHAFRLAQGLRPVLRRLPGARRARRGHARSRLALRGLTLKQLELALDLLGIAAPERM